MSLGSRATGKGGVKGGHSHQQSTSTSKHNHVDKGGKSSDKGKQSGDKGKGKETSKPQATTEQLRMASMIDRKGEDSDVRQMVKLLIEMTGRSEEEACSALHDADNDMDAACNILFEDSQKIQSEWQTNEKKKKKPPAASGGAAQGNGDPHEPQQGHGGGGRGGGRGNRSRGGGASGRGGGRPPRSRAPGGGGRGGRQPRGWPGGDSRGGSNSGSSNQQASNSFPPAEDWDNDDWSGSLSETKVFTPSVQQAPVVPENDIHDNSWSSDQASESVTITSHSFHNSAAVHQQQAQEDSWTTEPVTDNIPTHAYHNSTNIHQQQAQQPTSVSVNAAETHAHSIAHQPMGMTGTLTAAQSQYLSQLTQQSHLTQQTQHMTQQTQHLAQQTQHITQQTHQNVYGSYGTYGEQRKQRARVPPPSKIPSTAVEMPDQEEMGSGLLDVQFGALELETVVDTHQTPTPASEAPHEAYSAPSNNMMNENHSATTAPAELHPPATTAVLESSLSTSMKALSVSATYPVYTKPQSTTSGYVASTVPPYTNLYPQQVTQVTQQQQQQQQQQAQQSQQQVQQSQVVQQQQSAQQQQATQPSQSAQQQQQQTAANNTASINAQITSAYQYTQPLNSYQSSATGYSGVYTHPYTYTHHKIPKETLPPANQYDNNAVAATSNASSLASTSTTQTTTAKATTSSTSKSTVSNAQYTVPAPAFYTQQQGQAAVAGAPYPPYDDHLMRSATLPHHMTGYYEVGYGRDATFGLSGERFGRADAASPQQVLPPGYAYFYQPPPTTYQYNVYPQYGGGVGGVGGVAAGGGTAANKYGATPAAYEPPADYKPQPYPPAAKQQAGEYKQLPKVNSYEKAGAFHTAQPQPPMFTQSSLYIPHHHHHHQMDVRVNSSHRRENSSGGGRGGSGTKPAQKPTGYSQSYWTPN